ncbi:MAG: M24 family metallopeptidase [Anaerolineae bacterium]|nr:M24 family metallopeptidase [Anaerolineae bacterium]
MKTDIDRLMERDGLDALLVTGPTMHNPYMVYLAGGVHHVTQADLIKIRGQEPVLFHNDMERDEARKSGLRLRRYGDFNLREILLQTQNNEIETTAILYERMFRDMGITGGQVAVFGQMDVGKGLAIFSSLQTKLTQINLVGMGRNNFLTEAMQTKDDNEIKQITEMGQITTQVVAKTAEFIGSQRIKNGLVVKDSGEALTIGDVKKQISLWLAEAGAEAPEDTIFAIGRDAAVPHSGGTPGDLIRAGVPIVYDIFPCQAGGGYFYDFTRTWCVGHTPDKVLEVYEDVLSAYNRAVNSLKLDQSLFYYQKETCDFFDSRGHLTLLTGAVESGYIHSLSHGLGLNIHERPFTGVSMELSDKIYANSVFTVEPGLYYPEMEIGVRIEDTYWAKPDGSFSCLVQYPYDLLLPVKN